MSDPKDDPTNLTTNGRDADLVPRRRPRDRSHSLTPELGAALRAARERWGLTIKDAARLLDHLSPGHLRGMEKGDGAPSVAVAEAIIGLYRLQPPISDQLLAQAVPGVGRCRQPVVSPVEPTVATGGPDDDDEPWPSEVAPERTARLR
jgi:DNA-binding XRE family transcriptional regulator